MNQSKDRAVTFTVVLVDFRERQGAAERLGQVFGIDLGLAQQFVANMPAPVKRGAQRSEARSYKEALESIGAKVELRREMTPRAAPTPAPAAPAARPQPTPAAPAQPQNPFLAASPVASVPGHGPSPAPAPTPRAAPMPTPSPKPTTPAPRPQAAPSMAPALDGPREPIEFWPGVGAAFLVPVKKTGIAWMLALAGLLFLSSVMRCGGIFGWVFSIILGCVYVGTLAQYFGRVAEVGLSGETTGPDTSGLSNLLGNWQTIAFQGLVVYILFIVLLLPAVLVLAFAVPDTNEGFDGKVRVTRDIEEGEVFYDLKGEPLKIKKGGPAVMGFRDADLSTGSVLIDPAEGTVTITQDAAENTEEPELSNQTRGFLFLALLLPVFYLPMAMAIASMTGRLSGLFNPVSVIGGAVRGGLPYVFITALGVVLATLLTALEGSGIIFQILYPLMLTYVIGVQAYLMGRLIGSRPDAFEDFA